MEILKKLKKVMELRGLSQEKVARELKVSAKTVSRWLRDKHRPHEVHVERIKRFTKKYTYLGD